jgi:hypothetical protein
MGVKRRRRPRLFRLFDYQLGRRPFKARERGQHPHRRPFSRRLLSPRTPVVTHRAHRHMRGRQARSPNAACRTCSISLTVEYFVANEGNGARLPDAAPFSWIGSRSSERFGLLSRRAIGSIRGASPFRSTTGDWVISITSSPQNCAGRGGTGIAFHFYGALVIKPARSACTREESEGYRHAPPFRVGGLAALGNCLPSSIRWVRLPSGAPICRRCGKQTHVGSGRRARRPWPLASRSSDRSDKQFHPGMAEQQLRRAVDASAKWPTEVRVLLLGPWACSSKSEHAADNRATTARYRTCPPLSLQGDAASAGSHKPGTLVQLQPLHPISLVPRS